MKYFANFFKANAKNGIYATASNGSALLLRDHLADKDTALAWDSFGDLSNPNERNSVIDCVQFATRAALIAIKNFNILRVRLTQQLETTRKILAQKGASIQQDGALSFFNPNEGRAVDFLRCILEFPRFKVKHRIELGGLPYLDTEACQTYEQSWDEKDRNAIPPALLFAMQHGLLGVPPPEITDPVERQRITANANRLMFDEGLDVFKAYILEVSKFAGKDALRAGVKLTSALDRLVDGLESLDLDNFARLDQFVEDVLCAISNLRAELSAATITDSVKSDVKFLVDDVKKRRKANSQRGKTSRIIQYTKSDPDAAKRRDDIRVALRMVDSRIRHTNEKIINACRYVCAHFKLSSPKKDEFGKAEYYPLEGERKPITPETLARYYRAHKAKKAAN